MAWANSISAGGKIPHGIVVTPTSCYGQWYTIHNDLTAAAETTALVRPLSSTTSSVIAFKFGGPCTSFMLRGRYPQASTLTTNPVVRVYGVYPTADLGLAPITAFADDGTNHVMRLDNADASNTGVTVTMDNTNDLRDTTYRYTDPVTNAMTSGFTFDARGASWGLALTNTAAVISAGTMQLQILILN